MPQSYGPTAGQPNRFEPTDARNVPTATAPDNRPETGQTDLFALLESMRQWATDSIQYVKRRNHLSPKEKKQALGRLHRYWAYIDQWVNRYRNADLFDLPGSDLNSEMLQHLDSADALNLIARYYEFPPFPMPDNFKPTVGNDGGIYFKVHSDIRVNGVYKGDTLYCAPVRSFANLRQGDLLVLFVRKNHATPRELRFGLFQTRLENELFLRYDRFVPDDAGTVVGITVSLFDVVHIYKVYTVSRDRK